MNSIHIVYTCVDSEDTADMHIDHHHAHLLFLNFLVAAQPSHVLLALQRSRQRPSCLAQVRMAIPQNFVPVVSVICKMLLLQQ